MRRRRIASRAFGPVARGGRPGGSSPVLPAPPISGVVRHLEDARLRRARHLLQPRRHLADARPHGHRRHVRARLGARRRLRPVAYKRGFEPALQRLWHQAARRAGFGGRRSSSTKKGGATAADDAGPADHLGAARPPPDRRAARARHRGSRRRDPRRAAEQVRLSTPARRRGADDDGRRPQSSAASSLSRAAVGLHGGLPNGWQYGISGDYATLGDSDTPGEMTTGNAAGLALDVAPSADGSVRLSTRRNTLSFGDESREPPGPRGHAGAAAPSRAASSRSPRATSRRPTSTARPRSARRSSRSPRARWELNGNYGGPPRDTPGVAVAMTYRHREASGRALGRGRATAPSSQSAPDADLAASTSVRVSDRAGGRGRRGRALPRQPGGYGIAPAPTARYDVSDQPPSTCAASTAWPVDTATRRP